MHKGAQKDSLVHEIKTLIGQQSPEALAEVVVRVLRESHLLHGGKLVIARPDLLAR